MLSLSSPVRTGVEEVSSEKERSLIFNPFFQKRKKKKKEKTLAYLSISVCEMWLVERRSVFRPQGFVAPGSILNYRLINPSSVFSRNYYAEF